MMESEFKQSSADTARLAMLTQRINGEVASIEYSATLSET